MAALRMTLNAPTEDEEQEALFQRIDLLSTKYPFLAYVFMIPNGARLPATYVQLPDGKRIRYSKEGDRLKRLGLRPGIPDICCPYPAQGFGSLYIELKRLNASPSDTKPEQIRMHECLRMMNHKVCVCKGWREAWNTLADYLGLEGEHIE